MTKRAPRPARICPHDRPKDTAALMFRCRCGNVWMSGAFMGSVAPDQGALAIFGAFSRGPAPQPPPRKRKP